MPGALAETNFERGKHLPKRTWPERWGCIVFRCHLEFVDLEKVVKMI